MCYFGELDNASLYCKLIIHLIDLLNICIYVCIIKIQAPYELKNQRPIAKRSFQIKKYGQDVIIQNRHI